MRTRFAALRRLPLDIIRGSLAAAALLAGGGATAGVNELTSLGPEGGSIIDVAFHGTLPNVLYAATSSGFYRSGDGGASWQLTRREFFNFRTPGTFAVDPLDSERVYLAAFEAVLISNDGGRTFAESVLPRRQGEFFHIECGPDGVVYAPDGGKMYRSVDHGQTWQALGAFPETRSFVHAVAVDPTDSKVVYISLFGAGIFVSRDGGNQWQPLGANPATTQYTMHIEADPSNALRLWAGTDTHVIRSDNGGIDWTPMLAEGHVLSIEVDPNNPQVVLAASSRGTVLRTTDGGNTWSALPQQFGGGHRSGVRFHPSASERIAAFSDGIWLSADAGDRWLPANGGLIATGIRSIKPARGPTGAYVTTLFGGIHRLGDDNKPRAVDNARLGAVAHPYTLDTQDLAAAGTAGMLDTLVALIAPGQLARSLDGGSQWTAVDRPTSTALPTAVALANGAQRVLYVGTSEGVFSSLDLGDTWTSSSVGLPPEHSISRLVITSASSTIYATARSHANNAATVLRTTNGGQSWASTGLSGTAINGLIVHPADPQTVYVGLDNTLMRTIDGGATWTKLNADTDGDAYNGVAFDPRDSNVLYASALQRVLRSIDGGATWERLVVTQNAPASSTSIALDPLEADAVLVGSAGLGLRQLSIRPDLELVATAPASMNPNAGGTFTLQLRNRGPYLARNAQVTMQLPAAATGISATATAGSCSATGQQAVCTIPSLKLDETVSISLRATSAATGTFAVQASAAATEADANPSNNSVVAQSIVSDVVVVAPSQGGGGGGGGAFSLLMLLSLTGIFALRHRAIAQALLPLRS